LIPLPLYIFILIELIFVSVGDIKYRKIPNLWIILNLFASATLFISFPEIYEFRNEAFQFTVVFIIVGFALFLLKVMGGGDSKFLASFFLMIPFSFQDKVFSYLLVSTVMIGCAFFIHNIFKNHEEIYTSVRDKNLQGVKKCFGTKFPFAPVILVTWVLIGWDLKDYFLKILMN
jgi:prepilin peptidase CpaA